jgi:hypothetical protein
MRCCLVVGGRGIEADGIGVLIMHSSLSEGIVAEIVPVLGETCDRAVCSRVVAKGDGGGGGEHPVLGGGRGAARESRIGREFGVGRTVRYPVS